MKTTGTAKTPNRPLQRLWAKIAQRGYKSISRVSRFRKDLEVAFGMENYPGCVRDAAYDAVTHGTRGSTNHLDLLVTHYAVAARTARGIATEA